MKPPSKEFQEFHVAGIQAILNLPNGCVLCPQGTPNPTGDETHFPLTGNDESSCDMCRDFQNMIDIKPDCPCGAFGKNALRRAQLALDRWNKGKHKWQKKEKHKCSS